MDHPLENPIWNALDADHAPLAKGAGPVRRYRPDVAPFVGAEDEADLVHAGPLIRGGGLSVLFTRAAVPAIDGIAVAPSRPLDQMVARDAVPDVALTAPVLPLGDADVPDMIELVGLTRPGPFMPRTIEMGRYFGMRDTDGRLIAMVGERMRLPGHVEVSAVCTHPRARGRGLARQLVAMLARDIAAAGNTPFLHVLPENLAAKTLYAELGFVRSRTFHLTIIGELPL